MPRGGPRPGAGAPRGNLNALRSGMRSKQLKALIIALMTVPETRRALLHFSRMEQRRRALLAEAINRYAALLQLPSRQRSIKAIQHQQIRNGAHSSPSTKDRRRTSSARDPRPAGCPRATIASLVLPPQEVHPMAIDTSVIGKELPPQTFEYTERDVMLYALGVGCGTDELDFVYEKNLKVLPTFAVIPAFPVMMGVGRVVEINPAMVLHGEQAIELRPGGRPSGRAPIPTKGKLTTGGKISAIYDKGSGAVIVVDSETKDESGAVLFASTSSLFVRGAGGFGGDRGPSASSKNIPPERRPAHTIEYKTSRDQAALYRLSGDRNPLHIDPEFAKLAGFDRPILHGLCTFGHVGRAILHACCGGDPARFKSFEVRFSGVVYPGETIVTDIWKESASRVLVQARAAERREVVIANAAATVA